MLKSLYISNSCQLLSGEIRGISCGRGVSTGVVHHLTNTGTSLAGPAIMSAQGIPAEFLGFLGIVVECYENVA